MLDYDAGAPSSGTSYSHNRWADYAARVVPIVCVLGAVIKGGDGILYICR